MAATVTVPRGASAQPAPEPLAPPQDPEVGMVDETPGATLEAAPEAAPTSGQAPADAEPMEESVALSLDDVGAEAEGGLFLVAGKVGGLVSFNGLSFFLHGGVELGYVFGALDQSLAALLQVEYSAPHSDGSVTEDFDPERVPSGGYDWELRQKELVLQPTFVYRMTFLRSWVTPYVGLGLRIYLLQSVVRGNAGGETIGDTTERSTKWGFGVPLGAEFALGPGGVIAEVLVQWGPFEHQLTGDTNLGGLSIFAGYRLLL